MDGGTLCFQIFVASRKKVTTAIRNNLPPDTPGEVSVLFSGRSIRLGSVTETFLHGDVLFAQGCMRSGHSTGTTVDSHLDKNNVAHGIEAARARSGHNNLKERDHLPRLDSLGLGNHARVHRFVAELHKVTIKDFCRGGQLHPASSDHGERVWQSQCCGKCRDQSSAESQD